VRAAYTNTTPILNRKVPLSPSSLPALPSGVPAFLSFTLHSQEITRASTTTAAGVTVPKPL